MELSRLHGETRAGYAFLVLAFTQETDMSDCIVRPHPRAEPMDDPMLCRYLLPPPEPSP